MDHAYPMGQYTARGRRRECSTREHEWPCTSWFNHRHAATRLATHSHHSFVIVVVLRWHLIRHRRRRRPVVSRPSSAGGISFPSLSRYRPHASPPSRGAAKGRMDLAYPSPELSGCLTSPPWHATSESTRHELGIHRDWLQNYSYIQVTWINKYKLTLMRPVDCHELDEFLAVDGWNLCCRYSWWRRKLCWCGMTR